MQFFVIHENSEVDDIFIKTMNSNGEITESCGEPVLID